MKVMAICAGRKNGNGEILAKEALSAAQAAGAEVEMINLFDYNILPCTGCEGCTMQMGEVAMDPTKQYRGCVLKDKDDVDALIAEMHTCNGVIFSVPTYDLTPSSLYTRFAQRFLAYELSFLLEIGVVKENPNTVAGLIAVGGSMHDWQSLALESLQATMFTMSLTVVDRFMSQRVGRPGNVLLHQDQLDRAHQMGESIVKAIQTPVEERTCGGELGTNTETGRPWLVIDPENGHIRDRCVDKARAEHLNEIIQTRIDFFQRQGEVKPLQKKYREMKFPTFVIER